MRPIEQKPSGQDAHEFVRKIALRAKFGAAKRASTLVKCKVAERAGTLYSCVIMHELRNKKA